MKIQAQNVSTLDVNESINDYDNDFNLEHVWYTAPG